MADFWNSTTALPLTLVGLAVLGYLLLRRAPAGRAGRVSFADADLRKAQQVAGELERIAASVRRSLASHHNAIDSFKRQLNRLSKPYGDVAREELSREAEHLLTPTLELAGQIAEAYDQIRRQGNHLMAFTEVRTDPITGVANRAAMDDALDKQFALISRYKAELSVAVIGVDELPEESRHRGHFDGERMLGRVAQLLNESARETDVVARFDGERLVVVMPQTDIDGASVFAERWRIKVQEDLPVTISAGISTALDGDTSESLLARAEAALHAAESVGCNRVHRHNGEHIEPILEEAIA